MGANRTAAERTVEALRDTGALDEMDEATVQAFLSLADAVDNPEGARAELWREYRQTGAMLREAADRAGDDAHAFLINIQTPRGGRAEVGDTEES